ALIVPNYEKVIEWARRNQINDTDHEKLAKNPKVMDMIWSEVDRLNADFGKWEKVKKIALLTHEFTIDGGELTPKLSIKRKVILNSPHQRNEELYQDEEHPDI